MAAKTTTKTTATQGTKKTRKEQFLELTAQLTEQLAEKIETLTESDSWLSMLQAAAVFRGRYSLNNMLLICLQCPEATLVAGYKKWIEAGRQVRAGEKAIRIRGFSTKVITDEEDETKTKVITYYPWVSVFDISQTDPIEGAKDLASIEPLAVPLTGDDPVALYEHLQQFLHTKGWATAEESLEAGVNGYANSQKKLVVVEEALAPAQKAKTMAHETAHAILHDSVTPAEYHAQRGLWEAEAESVAYVIGQIFGLDTSDYSVGYVATWAKGDMELIKKTAERVIGGVETMVEGLAQVGLAAPVVGEF